jgi:hypothetical protein
VDSAGSKQGPLMDSCEHGNKPFQNIKRGGFVDQLNNYQLLKDSVPLSYMMN